MNAVNTTSDDTLEINRFYKEFCFSNNLIFCYWLSIDYIYIDSMLSGVDSLNNIHAKFIRENLIHEQSSSEIKALERVVLSLSRKLKNCEDNTY